MRQNVIRGLLVTALVVLPMTAIADTVFHLDSPMHIHASGTADEAQFQPSNL